MTAPLHFLVVLILSVLPSVMSASASPSRSGAADIQIDGRKSSGSFDKTPTFLSMLFVGGGLVLFGGLLRRRLGN